ncbi:hypothetical protein LSUE1_G008655, partial [Lachnellula suecica]
ALLEDKLYFYSVRERWYENYYTMRGGVLDALPYPAQVIVGLLAYRKISAFLYGQGTMRYTSEEIAAFRLEIWESVNALLVASKQKGFEKDAPFWVCGGAAPTNADTTVFGFVASAMVCDAGPASREVVKSFPVIVEYARRIHDTYYPDFALWE